MMTTNSNLWDHWCQEYEELTLPGLLQRDRDIDSLMSNCPQESREKFITIIRRFASIAASGDGDIGDVGENYDGFGDGYPTLFGAPRLMYWLSKEYCECGIEQHNLPDPAPGMQFVGLLPENAVTLSELPCNWVSVETNTITPITAVFRSDNSRAKHIPKEWWRNLFPTPAGETVFLSVQMLLPLPDAIEASRVLAAGKSVSRHPGPLHFLSAKAHKFAREHGQAFIDNRSSRAIARVEMKRA